MPPTPLADRVVEVIADLGEGQSPRHRYGSGIVVAGRTVLTAAHVVTGAVRVQVRDVDKVINDATLDPRFVGDTDGSGPDLALVEITNSEFDLPPMVLAAVDRDSPTGDPVERCHAIGYPTFMERNEPDGDLIRDTVDACGQVPALSRLVGGLLSVQVSSTPKELPPKDVALGDSQWSGISGGPLVAYGDVLGVVTEHAPREGSSAITVTPLTALEADPAHPGLGPGVADPGAWWKRLGVSGIDALRRLPARPEREEPAYWATVREIHSRTNVLLGRQKELAEIAAFATGPGGYLWLVGGAWAGKTSLLAEAVATTLPGQVDIVSYFLSRREADADSARFLEAVVPQLAYLCDQDRPTADVHQFRTLWQRATERAASHDRHLLMVVDGLDEDLRPPVLPSVAALLPSTATDRAHVLVGNRPYPELPSDVPVGHPLENTQPVELEPFAGAQALAKLARQEIDDLVRRDDDGLAADVLGLLTAAAGPLAVKDLEAMTEVKPGSGTLIHHLVNLVPVTAGRSLQPVGPDTERRYQFAHGSLLEYAQTRDDLNDQSFHDRIHRWAWTWLDRGWPTAPDRRGVTPRYLLDNYPSTLARDPQRLTALVSDAGWAAAAIQAVGVDRVLAALHQAAAADPSHAEVAAMLETVAHQAHRLRPPHPLGQPGYVLRQLWLQAAELTDDRLANYLQAKLRSQPGLNLVPLWTTLRASRALSVELGTHNEPVRALVVLPDGKVISGGDDGRVLVWDPTRPGTGHAELGTHDGPVGALAVLSNGQVVSGGADRRVLIWDPVRPETGPTELGRHDGGVFAVTALADGRVVSGADDGRVRVWDPARPETGPIELGRHKGWVQAVAVLPDGRVVSGDFNGRVLVWDPARPGTDTVELGQHNGPVWAVAVLPDGRVISGGVDRRVRVWDPDTPGSNPVDLGQHDQPVRAVAVLPDGRVVSGGQDERVLVWDHAMPGTGPVELGRHERSVVALAVLPEGRVVSGGEDRRVLVWDVTTGTEIAQVGCSVNALAAELPGPGESCLIIAHEGAGFSHWSITDCPPR